MKLLLLIICIFAYISSTLAISGTLYAGSNTCNKDLADTVSFENVVSNQCSALDLYFYGNDFLSMEINCQSYTTDSLYSIKVWQNLTCSGPYFGTVSGGVGNGISCVLFNNTIAAGSFIVDCSTTGSNFGNFTFSFNMIFLYVCILISTVILYI